MLFARRQFVSHALMAALAGCTAPIAGRSRSAIPFLSASAIKVGEAYRIEWQAAGVRHVIIHAGPTPSPLLRGNRVGQGTGSGSVMIHGLPSGQRPYFTLVPDKGSPLVIADRALHLPSIPNLRDIGGYRTIDGRWVKMGLLYRSDQLDRVSDADLEALGGLGLHFVADLRTQSERTREPDRLPPGSQPLILDVAADSDGSLGGDMRKAISAIASGKGVELLTAANRDFVSLGSARRAYATMLHRLAEPNGAPLLYHCTAGKDRTGWATAVILTILGVPRETVMADYLASNSFLKRKNAATVEALGKSGSAIDPANLSSVLTVRADYLNAAFAEVEKRFGTFDAYLRKGLNMSSDIIEYLRKSYTT
ncbi:tyrosine-protein phosphatase [Sphingobium sp.]|uniref:tyrosine-protein phosphatase n=1 Tax=Sphingobium sp. TaxID=1912891 RepID=UPI002C922E9A|nr:tyrosine-protein phosphatase [Sphingobium sp.]HUD93567.1 tyrosine-protein phosphatase [Sphingobium sp.]